MREATARRHVQLGDEAPSDLVLAHRYGLYCQAHDVLEGRGGANALMRVYAQASRCRRACEAIELAESLVENGFGRLAMQHIGAQQADCTDCVRPDCIASELAAGLVSELAAMPTQRRVVAG